MPTEAVFSPDHVHVMETKVDFPCPSFEDASLNETNGDYFNNVENKGWKCTYVVRLKNNADQEIVVNGIEIENIYESDHTEKFVVNSFVHGPIETPEPLPFKIQADSEVEIKVLVKRAIAVKNGAGFSPYFATRFEPTKDMPFDGYGGFAND